MVEHLKHLDKTRGIGLKFVVKQLDATHLLVERDCVAKIRVAIEKHMDSLTSAEQS